LGRGAAWIRRERVAAEESRRSAGRGRRGDGGGGDSGEGEQQRWRENVHVWLCLFDH